MAALFFCELLVVCVKITRVEKSILSMSMIVTISKKSQMFRHRW